MRFPQAVGMPMQALGSASDEYARILDLVGRYAIARPDVGFSCKKQVGAGMLLVKCHVALRMLLLVAYLQMSRCLAFNELVLLAVERVKVHDCFIEQ